MLPAHGPVIDDPLALIDQYLAIGITAKCRFSPRSRPGSTPWTPSPGASTPASTRSSARWPESVLAHLIKLEHDGLAKRDGARWVSVS